MKIAIGSDHAGFPLKEILTKHLQQKGFQVQDFGTYSEERADYPDFAHQVALSVGKKENDIGVLMCATGNGINMAANKHKGIRSALCWNEEVAALARQHNDANILTLPARCITEEQAKKIVDAFFSASFEGGRHTERVKKISEGC